MHEKPITFMVISFYTPNYADRAKRLIAGCRQFGLDHDIVQVTHREGPSPWPWLNTVRWKPRFILEKMLEHQDADAVVWIDADALIYSNPILFRKLKGDIAVHHLFWPRKKERELLSGTMFIRNTPEMRSLVRDWASAVESASLALVKPEQQVLQKMLARYKITVNELPHTYCHIHGWHGKDGCVVIEHFQASRVFRHSLDGRPVDRVPRQRRRARRHPHAPERVVERPERILARRRRARRHRTALPPPQDTKRRRRA